MINLVWFGSTFETTICNPNFFPEYHNNTLLYFARLLVEIMLISSFLFIILIIAFKCLAFLSTNNDKLFHSFTKIPTFKISISAINLNYEFAIVFLGAAIVAKVFLLYLDNSFFKEKRSSYWNRIFYLFNEKISTNYKNLNIFAEKYMNAYLEDVIYGIYSSIDIEITLIAFTVSVYLNMLFFHINDSGALDSSLVNKIYSFSNTITDYNTIKAVGVIITYLIPIVFCILYKNKYENYLETFSAATRLKVKEYLNSSDNLYFELKKFLNDGLINNFVKEIKSLKKNVIVIGSIAILLILLNKGFSLSIDGNNSSFAFVFFLAIFLNSIFADKILNPHDMLKKQMKTIIKIIFLQSVPRIKEIHDKSEALPFNGLSIENLPVVVKHESGADIENNHLNFTIKSGEKMVITHKGSVTTDIWSFNDVLINLHQSVNHGKVFIISNNKKIDITHCSINNLKKLITIHSGLKFVDQKTIFQNFQLINPNITEEDVRIALQHALITNIHSETIFNADFPRVIKYKLLIALIFAASKYSDLIVSEFELFSVYSSEDINRILSSLSNISCALIISIVDTLAKKEYTRYFDKVYAAKNYNLHEIKDFGHTED